MSSSAASFGMPSPRSALRSRLVNFFSPACLVAGSGPRQLRPTLLQIEFAGLVQRYGREHKLAARPHLGEPVEVGGNHGGDPWIAPGRLVVTHQDDRRAIAED